VSAQASSIVHFVLLHPNDNVLVCCTDAPANQLIVIGEIQLQLKSPITVGHKVAFKDITKGQKIVKYGVSIGSATRDIRVGEHVHMPNLKSDYIASHTRVGQNKQHEGDEI
jgi:(2R)-sulfolactate sulfo-lyase subunit alpha